jgi:hypothetical protein
VERRYMYTVHLLLSAQILWFYAASVQEVLNSSTQLNRLRQVEVAGGTTPLLLWPACLFFSTHTGSCMDNAFTDFYSV